MKREIKFIGTQRSKLRLRDKIVASLYLNMYSRLSSSNIYTTVNVPAMIAAQIIIDTMTKSACFAQLQPSPFNPPDAWTWITDLLSSRAKLIHCPKCGSLYVARTSDNQTPALPEDDSYDPNIDYSHPCPYCRYINTYCSFGCHGQSQRTSLKRKDSREHFFSLLAKEISPFSL